MVARLVARQEGEEALATARGGEVLPLLGLLPGSWGGGLDRRPSWLVGGHLGVCMLERMRRVTRLTPTPLETPLKKLERGWNGRNNMSSFVFHLSPVHQGLLV